MLRRTDSQQDMFDAVGLLPPAKRAACEKSWAGAFRKRALPILLRAEPEFAEFYDEGNGRPNRSVALVMGTLILKEANDLTDEEALNAPRFDVRWWSAFDLKSEESDLCQKTLHNFRVKLLSHEKGAVVFRRMTDGLIKELGIDVSRQRPDSTHILSNFALLNRLGLFCETIRVFLHALWKGHRDLHDRLPAGLLKRHGEESRYRDARREEGPRRLRVVARDLYRLVERFKEHRAIGKMEEFGPLKRQEAQPDFKKRYAIRAGIEATNSEFKRVQGGGKLRVRGERRVDLALQLKAAGCNLRRALRYWTQIPTTVVETAALPA